MEPWKTARTSGRPGQFASFFLQVEEHRYRDSLCMTGVEGVVLYAQSSITRAVERPALRRLSELVEEETRVFGGFAVSEEAGLLVARRLHGARHCAGAPGDHRGFRLRGKRGRPAAPRRARDLRPRGKRGTCG